jgi:iron complex outermembrane recepter protein
MFRSGKQNRASIRFAIEGACLKTFSELVVHRCLANLFKEVVILGGLLCPAAICSAQDASPTPAVIDEIQRIIVTGSHIPTAEESGPNPVLRITRDLIEKSGERTAEELIKDLPVANANGVPISNNANGPTPGASSISLRGFDTSATLVLIDGRRVAPYPIGAGDNGAQSFVDLNTIPGAAIDSIEVLKDGASTTYGADAIAGVINIRFRHDYRGAEATVEYGNTLDKDSGESSATLLFGVGDDKTQVSGVLSYYRRNSIANRDRGFSAKTPFLSSSSSPYNFELSRDAVVAAIEADNTITQNERVALIASLPRNGDGNPSPTFFGHPPVGTNGTASVSQFVYSRGPSSLFNFNQFSLTFPETERYGGFLNVEHKICSDELVLFADMLYQDVKVHNELAASATGPFLSPGRKTLFIPPQHPVAATNPASGQPFGILGGLTAEDVGAPQGAFNPFNPFQQFISGFTLGRVQEFGNRLLDDESDAFMTTLGLRGDKLLDGSWGYDTAFRYSELKHTSTGTMVSASRFNRILNAADPIFDPNSTEFIGTTVPFNPFGDYRVPIAANNAGINFATVHPTEFDISKLATFESTIYTTSLFKLPAGGLGMAFGGQFRREHIGQDLDQLDVEGDIIGVAGASSTNSGRKSYGLFAETDIPIFSSSNSILGFHSLEFTAAARFEYYLNNNTNVLVPKVGVRWQPFDDSFTIRSTWGEGFREPSLYELFGSSQSFLGGPAGDIPIRVNSNPALEPEDSRNFTAGIVYTPRFVQGLTVSLDIYDIERQGVVFLPSDLQVLRREMRGRLLPGEMVLRDLETNQVILLTKTYQNNGGERARGIDIGLQYQWQTPWGVFTSLTQATYLDSFRLAFTQSAPALEVSNSALIIGDDAYLKWKGISRFDWAWKALDIVATVRYTAGFHEVLFKTQDVGTPLPDGKKEHWVDQTWYFDAQATYEFIFTAPVEPQPVAGYSKGSDQVRRGKNGNAMEATQTANDSLPCWKTLLNNTSLTAGCNNVFGQDPPRAYGSLFINPFGYPGSIYDSTGRFVYVSLKKKF